VTRVAGVNPCNSIIVRSTIFRINKVDVFLAERVGFSVNA
jgi:hypothetical protein